MEKKYLLAMICLAMVSCSGDDLIKENTVSANEKQETFNFSSFETMDKKIDEISFMKERMEM